VQWGSKSSQMDGIIALPQIEQPHNHEVPQETHLELELLDAPVDDGRKVTH
jgi:hypothetical protein